MHHLSARLLCACALVLSAALALSACGDDGAPQDDSSTSTNAGDAGSDDAGSDDTGSDDAQDDTATPCALECAPPSVLDSTACACVTPPDDLDAQAADFTCLTEWPKVRRFHITNLLGRTEEALAVANNPEGGSYPVGTIIQLVPQEAMVKRREGFSPATGDWEFFFLNVSNDGTDIVSRGTTDVTNSFGGNCLDCHALAEPQWDFVCEQDHGCDPIPIGPDLIQSLQDSDPRCP